MTSSPLKNESTTLEENFTLQDSEPLPASPDGVARRKGKTRESSPLKKGSSALSSSGDGHPIVHHKKRHERIDDIDRNDVKKKRSTGVRTTDTEGKDSIHASLVSIGNPSVAMGEEVERKEENAVGEARYPPASPSFHSFPASHGGKTVSPTVVSPTNSRTQDSALPYRTSPRDEMAPHESIFTSSGEGQTASSALSVFPPLCGHRGPPALKGVNENGGVGGVWEETTYKMGEGRDGAPCTTCLQERLLQRHDVADGRGVSRTPSPTKKRCTITIRPVGRVPLEGDGARQTPTPPPHPACGPLPRPSVAEGGLSKEEITRNLRRKYAEEHARKSISNRQERPGLRKKPVPEGKAMQHSTTGSDPSRPFVQESLYHMHTPPSPTRPKENPLPTSLSHRRGSPPTSPPVAAPSASAPLLSTAFARLPIRAGTSTALFSPDHSSEGIVSVHRPGALPPRMPATASSAPAVHLAHPRDGLEKREPHLLLTYPVGSPPVHASFPPPATTSRPDEWTSLVSSRVSSPTASGSFPSSGRGGQEGGRHPGGNGERRPFLLPGPPLDFPHAPDREHLREGWGQEKPVEEAYASSFPLPRALLPSVGTCFREGRQPEGEEEKEYSASGSSPSSFPVVLSDRVPPLTPSFSSSPLSSSSSMVGPKSVITAAALPPVGGGAVLPGKSFLTPLSALLPLAGHAAERREDEKVNLPGAYRTMMTEDSGGEPTRLAVAPEDAPMESHHGKIDHLDDGTAGKDHPEGRSYGPTTAWTAPWTPETKDEKRRRARKTSLAVYRDREPLPTREEEEEGGGDGGGGAAHRRPKPIVKIGDSRNWRWEVLNVPTVYQPPTSTTCDLPGRGRTGELSTTPQDVSSVSRRLPGEDTTDPSWDPPPPHHHTRGEWVEGETTSRGVSRSTPVAQPMGVEKECPPTTRQAERSGSNGSHRRRRRRSSSSSSSSTPTSTMGGNRTTRHRQGSPMPHPSTTHDTRDPLPSGPQEVPVALAPSPPSIAQPSHEGSVSYRFPSASLRDLSALQRHTSTLSLLSHGYPADDALIRPQTFPGHTKTPTPPDSTDGVENRARGSGSHRMGKEDGEREWRRSITSSYSLFSHLSTPTTASHSRRRTEEVSRRESTGHGPNTNAHPTILPIPDDHRGSVFTSGWRFSTSTRSASSSIQVDVYHSSRDAPHPHPQPPSSLSDSAKACTSTPSSSFSQTSPDDRSSKWIDTSVPARTEGQEEREGPNACERGVAVGEEGAAPLLTSLPFNPMEAAVVETTAVRPDSGVPIEVPTTMTRPSTAAAAVTGGTPPPPQEEPEAEVSIPHDSPPLSGVSSSSHTEMLHDAPLWTSPAIPGAKEDDTAVPEADPLGPSLPPPVDAIGCGGDEPGEKGEVWSFMPSLHHTEDETLTEAPTSEFRPPVDAHEKEETKPHDTAPPREDAEKEKEETTTSHLTFPFEKKEVTVDDLARFMKNTRPIYTSFDHDSSSASSSSSSSSSSSLSSTSPPYRKHSGSPPCKTRSPLQKGRREENELLTETMKENSAEFALRWEDSDEEDLLLFAPEQGVLSHPLTAHSEAPGRTLRVGSGSSQSVESRSPGGSSTSSVGTYSLPSSSTNLSEGQTLSAVAQESRSRRDRYRRVLMGCGILYHQFFRQAGLVPFQGEMLIAPFCVDENWFSVEVAVYGLCLASHFCKGLEELTKEKNEKRAVWSRHAPPSQRGVPSPHSPFSPVSKPLGRLGGGSGWAHFHTNATTFTTNNRCSSSHGSSAQLSVSSAGKQYPPVGNEKSVVQRATGLIRKATNRTSHDFVMSPLQDRSPSRLPVVSRDNAESGGRNSPLLPGVQFPLPDDFVWLALMSLSSKFYGELTYTTRSLVRRMCNVHEPSTIHFVDSFSRSGNASEGRLNSSRMIDSQLKAQQQQQHDRMNIILKKRCITSKETKSASGILSQADLFQELDDLNTTQKKSGRFGGGNAKKSFTSAFFRQRKSTGVERELKSRPGSRPASVRGSTDVKISNTRSSPLGSSSPTSPPSPLTNDAKLSQMEWIVWRAMKYDSYVSTAEYREMEAKAFVVGSS